jgi:YVTN family beta-propeller protein
VANNGENSLSKVNPATGSTVGTYSGIPAYSLCFDGTSIWSTDFNGGGGVYKTEAATGKLIANYPTGAYTTGICFDGRSIWVSNSGDNTVTQLNATTGALIGTYPVGQSPLGICFDGASIWVGNALDNTLSRF